jgi:hypothetical protein
MTVSLKPVALATFRFLHFAPASPLHRIKIFTRDLFFLFLQHQIAVTRTLSEALVFSPGSEIDVLLPLVLLL